MPSASPQVACPRCGARQPTTVVTLFGGAQETQVQNHGTTETPRCPGSMTATSAP